MRNDIISKNREFREFINHSTCVEGRNGFARAKCQRNVSVDVSGSVNMPRSSQSVNSSNSFVILRLTVIEWSISRWSSLSNNYPRHLGTINLAFLREGKEFNKIQELSDSESFNSFKENPQPHLEDLQKA